LAVAIVISPLMLILHDPSGANYYSIVCDHRLGKNLELKMCGESMTYEW